MARAGRKPDPNAPTPERLAKGDVVSYTPRDFGDSKRAELAPQFESRVYRKDPLAELLARGSIDRDEFNAGHAFAKAHARAIREVGAIDYDAIGGNGFADGLPLSRCIALDAFGALCLALGATDHDRLTRRRILISVACEGRSLSSLYPGKGRPLATASHALTIGLQRLAMHLEATRLGQEA